MKVNKDVEEEMMNIPKKMSSYHLLQGRNEKSMYPKLFSHPIRNVFPWLIKRQECSKDCQEDGQGGSQEVGVN